MIYIIEWRIDSILVSNQQVVIGCLIIRQTVETLSMIL